MDGIKKLSNLKLNAMIKVFFLQRVYQACKREYALADLYNQNLITLKEEKERREKSWKETQRMLVTDPEDEEAKWENEK